MQKRKVAGVYALLTLTFFFWGSIYVATKYLSGAYSASVITALRAAVALPFLWLLARKTLRPIEKGDWPLFAAVALLGYYGTWVINMMGVARAGASVSALLNTLNPVTMSLLAAVLLKEKIRPIQLVCLALALAGGWVVLGGAAEPEQFTGLLLVLLSVFTWSGASVVIRKLTARYSAAMVTFVGMLLALPLHLVTAGARVVSEGGLHFTPLHLAIFLYLGLFGSAVAQVLWSQALSALPTATCSLFYPLQPVFSALLGALFLGETFGPRFFIGLVLIGGDIVLNCLDGLRRAGKAA